MEITDIRIKKVSIRGEKLRAFATVTLDGAFVVSDIKVIDGANGLFIAMPSRKITDRCARCGGKNHLRAKFCNECGGNLPPDRVSRDAAGRAKLHVDIAHPINPECRRKIQDAIVQAYAEAAPGEAEGDGGKPAEPDGNRASPGGTSAQGDDDMPEREIFT